jgi:hypothetical protein
LKSASRQRRSSSHHPGDDTNEPENLIAAAIDAAEDIRDPLEGLLERTATDPGAPFAPDTLVQLVVLRKDDRAAFEALRARLKDEHLLEEIAGILWRKRRLRLAEAAAHRRGLEGTLVLPRDGKGGAGTSRHH